MSPPLVSVITIFLDAERFIEEAIASVFAQTWPHWELLLVDDGSSDRSTVIAKTYAERHPGRVRYLEHPGHVNRGMSASRNLGLARARGKLVAFLDADDVFLPERLVRHVELFAAHPDADVVQSGAVYWHSWAGYGKADEPEPVVELEHGRISQPPSLLRLLILTHGATAPVPVAVTVRRRVVGAVGGFENSFRGLYEDQVLFAKLYLNAAVLIDPAHVALYRQHSKSCTGQARDEAGSSREREARRVFFVWLRRELAERAPAERELIALVERELRPVIAGGIWGLRSTLARMLPPRFYQAILAIHGGWKHRRLHRRIASLAPRPQDRAAGDRG